MEHHAASMVFHVLLDINWLIISMKWKELFIMAPEYGEALDVCLKCSTQSEYVVHDGDC